MYKSILQIALRSWIYMLLGFSRETGLAINFEQGTVVPRSENKRWSIIVICPHPCLPPQSFGSLGGRRRVHAAGAKQDRTLSREGIDRYWGCRTLIRHFEASRSHGRRTETRTWSLIDCTATSWAIMYSAHFLSMTPKHNSHQDANSGGSDRDKDPSSLRARARVSVCSSLLWNLQHLDKYFCADLSRSEQRESKF